MPGAAVSSGPHRSAPGAVPARHWPPHHDKDTASLTRRHLARTIPVPLHACGLTRSTTIPHLRCCQCYIPLTRPPPYHSLYHTPTTMPAATTFVRRNVNKLMAVGPAHVTSAGTLKARRKGEQAPAAPDAALDASDVSPNAVLQAVRGLENHRQRTKKMPHRKDRKRRTASQAAHAGFARKVASLGVEESDGSEDEGDLGVSQPALDVSAVGEEDVDTSPPVTLQVLVKPAKVPKRKGQTSWFTFALSLLTSFGCCSGGLRGHPQGPCCHRAGRPCTCAPGSRRAVGAYRSRGRT